MARTIMCLPLCLLLAPSYPGAPPPDATLATQAVATDPRAVGVGLPDPAKDVLGFLDACLKKYEEKVKGYTCIFRKRERIAGTLLAWETISASYREEPHAVYFDWQEGSRRAIKALYFEGDLNAQGKRQVRALPALLPIPMTFSLDSADSKSSGRYTLDEFGLKQAMKRVIKAWKAAAANKALHVEYLGLHKVPDLGGKLCHKFHRYSYAQPEDGTADSVIFIECDTLLQIGTILKTENGEPLGDYYFREIQLNPTFPPNQFEPTILKK